LTKGSSVGTKCFCFPFSLFATLDFIIIVVAAFSLPRDCVFLTEGNSSPPTVSTSFVPPLFDVEVPESDRQLPPSLASTRPLTCSVFPQHFVWRVVFPLCRVFFFCILLIQTFTLPAPSPSIFCLRAVGIVYLYPPHFCRHTTLVSFFFHLAHRFSPCNAFEMETPFVHVLGFLMFFLNPFPGGCLCLVRLSFLLRRLRVTCSLSSRTVNWLCLPVLWPLRFPPQSTR